MAEDLDFRRRLAELERRFLRPDRAPLDALAQTLEVEGSEPGARVWARAVAAGIVPRSWADAPERRFRATASELERFAPHAAAAAEVHGGGRRGRLVAAPPTAHAALLFASDPLGMARAEQLAWATVEALAIWGALEQPTRVAWRLAGNPVDHLDAGGPSLTGLIGPLERLRAALSGSTRIYEPPHRHRRFQLVVDLLHADRRRALLGGSPIPASVRLLVPASEVAMPAAVVGRSVASLPDPLTPWLELIATGYSLWAIREGVLELAAPFDRATSSPRFDRATSSHPGPSPATGEPSRLRAVWSAKLTKLRLACARGDVGTVRGELPLLLGDDEPDQPRLIHFAVYGGPDLLRALAELGHAPLEARDPAGRTPLMLAAALPREGPAGAARHEIDVPISDIVGARSCEWLLAAGADPDARDGEGQTALHHAAAARRLHAVASLVAGGASIDAVDRLGRTPLLRAVAGGVGTAGEIVEVLLAAGADPDHRDIHGWTALHYLATAVDGVFAGLDLSRRLLARGIPPSRDLAGRSPADLVALRGVSRHDRGAFDLRTPVAAGPGVGRKRVRVGETDPGLIAELVAELVPDPVAQLDAQLRAESDPEPDHDAQPRTRRKRGPSEAWSVWADWLQDRGDPRGELVATSIAAARVGARRRRRLRPALLAAEQRCAPALLAGLWQADPFAPVRPSPIDLKRTHGFVSMARLSHMVWSRHSALVGSTEITRTLVAALGELLDHEPLLADLRLDAGTSWTLMLAGLAALEPATQVRRLVLEGLPRGLPELPDLHLRLPALRELWLIGAGKINRGVIRWPGLRALRVRHGDTSEWTQGGVELELRLPDLRLLDLSLPVGMRTVPAEIEGCVATLARLPALEHLRLRPLAPEFAAAILAAPILAQLRTLELAGVRGQTLAVLLRHREDLARLERVDVEVTEAVAGQRGNELADLQADLPRLRVRVR